MPNSVFHPAKLFIIGCFTFLLFSVGTLRSAEAALSALGVSIFPPLEFPPQTFDVAGARFNLLWGRHARVYGLELGTIGGITNQDFIGISVSGIFNWNKGGATVVLLQAAGLANVNLNRTDIYGVQIASFVNSNPAECNLTGVQLALVNYGPYTWVNGLQLGIYNSAHTVYGFQIGIINDTQYLHGIQIGLINLNRQGLFYVSPILNIDF